MPNRYERTLRACFLGFIAQAVNINLLPLFFITFHSSFGISFEQLGRLVLINFSVQILADIVATKYVDRIGYRPAILASFALSFAGLTLLGPLSHLMPSAYIGLATAVVLYSFGSGLIEVLMSPIVESLPSDAKAARMSIMHSFYCWGQMAVVLLTTLVIRLIGGGMWPYISAVWALIPLVGFIMFLRAPLDTVKAGQAGQVSIGELLKTRVFLVSMLLMVCSGSAELVMSQWSSLFAEKALGVSKLMGDLLGPCLFAVCMGIGRVLCGAYGSRINLDKTLLLCSLGSFICYLTTVFARNPILSLAGCAVNGLMVALMWPGTLSLSAARFPLGGTAMFGILAISGDIGGSLGPWLSGVVSDAVQGSTLAANFAASTGMDVSQIALKGGLLIGSIFPLTLFITLALTRRSARKENS